jgi:competence protein ComEA
LAWLERNQYLVLGIAGLLLLAGLLVRDLTEGTPPALVLEEPQTTVSSVVVHVAGAVAAPGLYELPSGARVQDALVAAGGALPDAEVDSINLARHLRDGEKVNVRGLSSDVAAAVVTLAPGQKLDLNVATKEELDQLPGIGEAYSRRIVDSRIIDGPYQAVDDLVARRVVPAATLEDIRAFVTVSSP